jgi:Leucine-rich repeat (LRR) protein
VQELIRRGARFGADREGWIKQVRFYGPEVTDDDLPVLARFKRLQSLFLLNTRATSAGIERLRASHPTLKVLPDFRTPIAEEVEAVAALQSCGADIRYDPEGYVQNVQFTDENLRDDALAPLSALTRLEGLGLRSPHITSEGLLHVEHSTSLQLLWLWYSPLSDAALERIKGLTHLKNLAMQGPGITDAGVPALRGLKSLTNLTLKNTSVTGATLAQLDLPALQQLDLGGSPINDAGLEKLPQWPALKRLNLTASEVSDDGLRHLLQVRSLEVLTLNGTRITDRGLIHLQALPALNSLQLQHTGVTSDGVEQFLKAKPGCRVRR